MRRLGFHCKVFLCICLEMSSFQPQFADRCWCDSGAWISVKCPRAFNVKYSEGLRTEKPTTKLILPPNNNKPSRLTASSTLCECVWVCVCVCVTFKLKAVTDLRLWPQLNWATIRTASDFVVTDSGLWKLGRALVLISLFFCLFLQF